MTLRTKPESLVEGLIASFSRTLHTPEGTVPPVAVVWTDQEAVWLPVVSRLRTELLHLFTLGDYVPQTRTGPTIWLKCIVDRTLPDAPPPDVTPILYLPGVSRQELRAGGDCRPAYQPLVELLFRGRAWHQENGKDWSVEAFLVADEGLGLDVARDTLTRDAIARALPVLAATPLDGLRGRRLDAQDFDHLTVPDPVRDVLRWLSAPEAFRAGLDDSKWQTFCLVCRSTFGVDPKDQDREAAAQRLVQGGGGWDDVWQRFSEAPRTHKGIAALLHQTNFSGGRLLFDGSRSPQENDRCEAEIRAALQVASGLPHVEASARILALEREHGHRREWVWAALDESPLAEALLPLSRLAGLVQLPAGGNSFDSLVAWYAADGWRADRAAIDSLAIAEAPAVRSLVASVVRALYEPWLDSTARALQGHVDRESITLGHPPLKSDVPGETCVLFADGLRFDIGIMLQEKLEARELLVQMASRLAPVPTATATAKPLASPASDAMAKDSVADDFTPMLASTRQPANVVRLRDEMRRRGVDVMDGDDVHAPAHTNATGWSERGNLDELGHKLGLDVARHIDDELDIMVDRIGALLQSGWSRVRVVTDHGWLLMPGGLPKVVLPPSLTATKWARCATVRGDSHPEVPVLPWYWNPEVRIACPPGIGSFIAGAEYAHGGVSLQECVIPELTVERGAEVARATITDVQWRGMRLRVRGSASVPGITVDLRTNAKQPGSSLVASAKYLDANGEASLVVIDDKHEGAAAVIVVLDANNNILDRRPTTVGEPS
jgi:hypothetical protein